MSLVICHLQLATFRYNTNVHLIKYPIFVFKIFYVWVCFLHVYLCFMCVPGAYAYKGQKKSPCALELELQVDVSHCVGAEN